MPPCDILTASLGKDARQHVRMPMQCAVRLVWSDYTGANVFMQGRCRNASQTGICIEVDKPIPRRALVTMQVERLAFNGGGTVRHSSRAVGGYLLGVELSTSIRLQTKR